jgi:hypothetical protein
MQREQVLVELQVTHPVIEQLKTHCEALAVKVRPEAHEEHVAVELQVTQLGMEQLNRQKLLLRMLPVMHEEQVVVELQTRQPATEQLKKHCEALLERARP